MRVMPSVTDTIAPTLRASVTDLKFSMRCLIRSLISVALMAMCVPLCCQFVGDALEPRALRLIERRRRGHRDVHHALSVILQRVEQLGDLRQVAEAVVVRKHTHEVRAMLSEGNRGDLIHELRELLRSHLW